ncbi:MAG: 4a-hydroxytetrahydrobiopterin dehydratase [Roseimicrobium sp.]
MAEVLEEPDIAKALATLPSWQREGSHIVRTFAFASYMLGIRFVQSVAELAETSNHHPDIHIAWRKVTLRLSTHSKRGLTEKDFALARAVDALAAE